MITRLICLFWLIPFAANAQVNPPQWFDAKWNPVSAKENAWFYRITEYSDSTYSAGTEKNFYVSGKPYSIDRYSSFFPLTRNGKQETWYENGTLKSEAYYLNNQLDSVYREWYEDGTQKLEIRYLQGKLHGQTIAWHPNGTVSRRDNFKAGKLVSGTCFNADGSNRFYETLEKEPDLSRLRKHTAKELKYPKQSRRERIEGDVLVYFVVDEEGRIVKVRLLRGVNEELNNEALRVMRTAPMMIPGRVDGKPFPYAFISPVRFKLR